MPLPTPDEISWSDWSKYYKINTPTFRLAPVEKPDMSPFLVHMTGKQAIIKILLGNGAPKDLPSGYGYLQANVPEYNSKGTFDAKVVCFTESPTFALDFFRYRSIERWKADQRFGIGFDKSALVALGARPVIYVEDDVMKTINFLYHRINDDGIQISPDKELNAKVNFILEKMYPLLYPLLENHPSQGFMWEREWRYPDPNGFIFDYQAIRVICCPRDEEDGIREILGGVADQITFVRTWQEYDDVTSYLRRQEAAWRSQELLYEESQTAELEEQKQHLHRLIEQYSLAYHSLASYETFIATVSKEYDRLREQKEHIRQRIDELREQLDSIEGQIKENSSGE